MKTILAATALLAGMTMAATPVAPPAPSKPDSAVIAHFQVDSAKAASIHTKLDSLKAKFQPHATGLILPDSIKARLDHPDSTKVVEFKGKVDSMRVSWEAKRDSQIANIKDTAVQAKIKARVAEIDAHRAAVQAKVDACKADIEAKIAKRKAEIDAAKAAKTTTK